MEISYVDYSSNLFKVAIDNNSPKVYIFANYASLLAAKKYYQRPFLETESSFLMLSDLKERLFPANKVLLKEEKLTLIFYQLLMSEEKEELKINNYNDAISLANDFFNFYEELAQYQIEKIERLNDWQQEKYDLLEDIRQRYI